MWLLKSGDEDEAGPAATLVGRDGTKELKTRPGKTTEDSHSTAKSSSTAHLKPETSGPERNTRLRKKRTETKKKEEQEKAVQALLPHDEEEDDPVTPTAASSSAPDAPHTPLPAKKDTDDMEEDTRSPSKERLSESTVDDSTNIARPRIDMGALEILIMRSQTPNRARSDVAQATQFDLLLPLTKPIIPLVMLICTGQVWSGIMSSLIISQILRSWVPKMNYETHHTLCWIFGFIHTMLQVSEHDVQSHAEKETGNLLLRWEWSFKVYSELVSKSLISSQWLIEDLRGGKIVMVFIQLLFVLRESDVLQHRFVQIFFLTFPSSNPPGPCRHHQHDCPRRFCFFAFFYGKRTAVLRVLRLRSRRAAFVGFRLRQTAPVLPIVFGLLE